MQPQLVVPHALDDRDRPRVAHREPLARPAGAEELAAGSAVQDRVAEQNRVAGIALGARIAIRPPLIDLPT